MRRPDKEAAELASALAREVVAEDHSLGREVAMKEIRRAFSDSPKQTRLSPPERAAERRGLFWRRAPLHT